MAGWLRRRTAAWWWSAYPAVYGVSGIMSFLVNQDKAIYEQNLGKNTLAIASTGTAFNPDSHWRNVKVLAKDQ